MKNTISIAQARNVILHCQELNKISSGGNKKSLLKSIEHLGYVQIDTLAVVERAHHHTLWSRNKNYKNTILEDLMQKDKSVFEYWSHAASYLPMCDYRFSLLRKNEYLKGKQHWFEQDKKVMRFVLDRIKAEGALMSKDFDNPDKNKGSWYYWKPAKKALEQLFMEGSLMVAGRKGFQKVYDITERVLPTSVNTKMPTANEYAEFLITSAIRSNGIITESEIGYLKSKYKPLIKKKLLNLVKQGSIVKVKVEGLAEDYYTSTKNLKYVTIETSQQVHILSPFDNLLIQRKRIEKLFSYNYLIECYVPEHKRVHGYFCLPLLYGNNFIGRADMKADRQNKTLIVKKLILENKPIVNAALIDALKKTVTEFASFNDCTAILVESTNATIKTDRLLKSVLKIS